MILWTSPNRFRMPACLALAFLLLLRPAPAAVVITDPGQGIFDFTGFAAGLSGITWLGGNNYYAVSDSVGAPYIHQLSISLNPNGTIAGAALGSSLPLAAASDPESIAFHAGRGTIFVSD